MSRNAGKLKPYVFGFAVSNSWSRQSNAFERSVYKAPKTLQLSTDLFYVSNITRRQCSVLYHFQKNFSKVVDKVGRILIALKFTFISFLPFLCTNVTATYFKQEGNL